MTIRVKVLEGNRMMLDGGAMFGHAPKELWKQWLKPDAQNRIPVACRSLLIQHEKHGNILFDPGVGCALPPKLLDRFMIEPRCNQILQSLSEEGISEEEINYVIFTHLHFDHCGGVLSSQKEGQNLLFPHAQYLVSELHWQRAKQPLLRDKASFPQDILQALERSGRLCLLLEKDLSMFGKDVSLRFSHGHTPGLIHAKVQAGREVIFYPSDLLPASLWVNPALVMGYDCHADLVCIEKQALLKEIIKEKGKVIFIHDAIHSQGFLQQDAHGGVFCIFEE